LELLDEERGEARDLLWVREGEKREEWRGGNEGEGGRGTEEMELEEERRVIPENIVRPKEL
jgi:hypothetical protein